MGGIYQVLYNLIWFLTIKLLYYMLIYKIIRSIHKLTDIHFYLYCGYTVGGYEYTCIFCGKISDQDPRKNKWFFDNGIRVSRNFYEKYLNIYV